MKTVHILVSGTVQGIGYRQFVKSFAKKNNVVGWVRNTSDGRVEGVLQGSEEKIDKLIKILWKGPFLAEVKDIITAVLKEEESENFSDFTIRKD